MGGRSETWLAVGMGLEDSFPLRQRQKDEEFEVVPD